MRNPVPTPFRGCVLVRKNGETLLQVCQGMRDLPNALPNGMDTRFPTASAGKAFVAVAILQLIEQGRLDFEETLGELLPFDLGAIDPQITVRQLLSHTSGVPDYFDESVMEDYADLWRDFPNYRIRRNSDLFALFFDKPMLYAPGERFQYNNSGYVMLAAVIEQLTGLPFDEHLQSAVFEPAGMKDTGYFELDRLPGNCANAYIWDEARQDYYCNIFSVDAKGTGCGGAYTTVKDAAKFWDALYGGRLLSDAFVELMTCIQAEAQWEDPYGFGLWLKRRDEALLPYFTGCDPGISFISMHDPVTGLEITVASNFGDDVWALQSAILEIML